MHLDLYNVFTSICCISIHITIYNDYNCSVFACFLDESKAFDRINHWTKFNKFQWQKITFHANKHVWHGFQQIYLQWYKIGSSFLTILMISILTI